MMQPRGSTLAVFVLVALAFRLAPYGPACDRRPD